MATTRIIPMHVHKGKTPGKCYQRALNYAKNPKKTRDGELVSSYGCNPETAAEEWALSRMLYRLNTGRDPQNEVLMYQVRQSFKPGEITPEEANQIGREFADRFLKGKHAYVVCTHIDKDHIHNHIEWNAIALDCQGKWRDFYRSGRAVARLSDLICIEHSLSVILDPGPGRGRSYNKWLGDRVEPSHRSQIRMAIDDALEQAPADIDELYAQLEQQGYSINHHGSHTSIMHPSFKQAIRFDSLGAEYTEADLQAVIAGDKEHTCREIDKYAELYVLDPDTGRDADESDELIDEAALYEDLPGEENGQHAQDQAQINTQQPDTEPLDSGDGQQPNDETQQEQAASQTAEEPESSGQKGQTQNRNRAPRARKPRRTDTPQAVIDIREKLAEGKGEGYRIWASRENIKRMAKTKLYMDEHNLTFDGLAQQQEQLSAKVTELEEQVQKIQSEIDTMTEVKRQIVNYAKTIDVFKAYKDTKYSQAFYAAHKDEIDLHYAAKTVFNQFPAGTKLTVKGQQEGITALQQERKKLYTELARTRKEARELMIHKANIEALQNADQPLDMPSKPTKSHTTEL